MISSLRVSLIVVIVSSILDSIAALLVVFSELTKNFEQELEPCSIANKMDRIRDENERVETGERSLSLQRCVIFLLTIFKV